ncbi:MAG: hypothetical protein EA402_09740 [Planctomycetota bacterium]|nr:MAG: hypothetical protein EA402_09740 [Planctomycetota bacterium]
MPLTSPASSPQGRIWQHLDAGDVWPGGDAADSLDLALAAIERRCEQARRAGLQLRPSPYLAFLMRARQQAQAQAQATLAKAG